MTTTKKWIGACCLSAIGGLLACTAGSDGNWYKLPGNRPSSGYVSRLANCVMVRPGAARTAASPAGDNLDQKIAVCLLLGNQEEVARRILRSNAARTSKFGSSPSR